MITIQSFRIPVVVFMLLAGADAFADSCSIDGFESVFQKQFKELSSKSSRPKSGNQPTFKGDSPIFKPQTHDQAVEEAERLVRKAKLEGNVGKAEISEGYLANAFRRRADESIANGHVLDAVKDYESAAKLFEKRSKGKQLTLDRNGMIPASDRDVDNAVLYYRESGNYGKAADLVAPRDRVEYVKYLEEVSISKAKRDSDPYATLAQFQHLYNTRSLQVELLERAKKSGSFEAEGMLRSTKEFQGAVKREIEILIDEINRRK